MANHASAKKRARQALKRNARNRHLRSTMRTLVKRVREAITQEEVAPAQAALKAAVSKIDQAVTKGVLHRRTASRYISRLSSQVAALS
ncbi:MAG: 30S ribosomal protein S20 [Polyangiales bacterium]